MRERDLRILLVKDHSFQLFGLEILLNRLGFFRLTPALDSTEALKIIKSGRYFDLLLSDQHLPDGRGIDLIESAHRLGGIGYAMLISGIDDLAVFESLLSNARQKGTPRLACLSKPLCPTLFLNMLKPI